MDAADLDCGHLIERKGFIVSKAARRKCYPRPVLVAVNHFTSLHDAIQLAAAAVESGNECPPKILMWVADMGQFPVENRGNVTVLLEKISYAIIALNDRHSWRRWAVLAKPQAGPIQHRVIENEGPGHQCAARLGQRTVSSLARRSCG